MKFRLLIVVICLGIIANAQTDSILYELNKIKTKNTILRIKDSLREAIVKDELGQIVGAKTKNKELEKYKQELLKIKREDSINIENQRKCQFNGVLNKNANVFRNTLVGGVHFLAMCQAVIDLFRKPFFQELLGHKFTPANNQQLPQPSAVNVNHDKN